MSIFDRLKLSVYYAATWQNIHYGLAGLATIAAIVKFLQTGRLDLGFAGFVTGLWASAVGNDLVNTPPTK